ncbi:L-aspartate oxidase [Thalassobacillus pellis]|uniref:L-aspartate oxidase n=1 Tax=Thalassobacillus pellis TaxID=748008 RepID=UPI001961753D|nr:L-aspartate oxidase [Thalassobacillus pellis]MBM7554154.1 L-aspartate oxidase [Thalassobacillus pellis]
MKRVDVIVVGTGIGALQLLKNLRTELNVMVLTKSSIKTSNSSKAQGGVAAAIGSDDSSYDHYLDTLEAGRFINDHEAVIQMTREAPEIIGELLGDGCRFDKRENGMISLGREGSHHKNRIVHGGGDQTGKRIVESLLKNVGSNITVKENEFVYSLLTCEQGSCMGVRSKDKAGYVNTYTAPHIVLATGGCGQVFASTSNAETVTGDGLALAYQAGAELVDMEFVQFHPTLLQAGESAKGLVSEAVRGEGAILVTKDGVPIMEGVHPLKDLAPRHVVSQTIYENIKQGEDVFLDIRPVRHFGERFPTVARLCSRYGVSLEKGKIPVVPGCHFLMGGVKTDAHGRTNVKGLYAVGEVACTGVHGANRLASNSLLEALVYGKRLAAHINSQPVVRACSEVIVSLKNREAELKLPQAIEIKESMMERVGIMRSKADLLTQKKWLDSFAFPDNLDSLSKEETEVVFMLVTARLITDAAIKREESRGGHYRKDLPFEREEWRHKHIHFQKYRKQGEMYESVNAPALT